MTDLEFLHSMRRKVTDSVMHANFTHAQMRRIGDIYPFVSTHAWEWTYLNNGKGTAPASPKHTR